MNAAVRRISAAAKKTGGSLLAYRSPKNSTAAVSSAVSVKFTGTVYFPVFAFGMLCISRVQAGVY